MKILVGILIVLVAASGFLYYRISQERATLEKLVAYHSENTRGGITERWRDIGKQFSVAIHCYDKYENPKLLPSVTHLKALKAVADSAQLQLKNMNEFASDQEKLTTAYEDYKQWLTSKASLFTNMPVKPSELMFNTFLGLNEKLLPKSTGTAYQNATEINTLVLEDAISSLILREVDQEMVNFGGCLFQTTTEAP